MSYCDLQIVNQSKFCMNGRMKILKVLVTKPTKKQKIVCGVTLILLYLTTVTIACSRSIGTLLFTCCAQFLNTKVVHRKHKPRPSYFESAMLQCCRLQMVGTNSARNVSEDRISWNMHFNALSMSHTVC